MNDRVLKEKIELVESTTSQKHQETIRILKVIRKEHSYILKIVEDGKVLQKGTIKNLNIIEKQLNGIEQEVALYWQDKKGRMNIRLNSKGDRVEMVQFVNYSEYPKDALFQKTIERIQKKSSEKKKLKHQQKASKELIEKTRKSMTALALLGTGVVLYALHLDANTMQLIDKEQYEIVYDEKEQEVENIFEEMELKSRYSINESVEKLPVTLVDKNIKHSNTYDFIELYQQPLLPTELNLHMYVMAQKYEIPYQSLITIAHVESDGKFDNHGIVGCTGDVGVMQINPSNFPILFEELGYTPEQIQNDDQANIECAAFLLKDICKRNNTRNGYLNMDEVYREYNGGGNFKNIPVTLKYLEKATTAMNQLYNSKNIISVKAPRTEVRK